MSVAMENPNRYVELHSCGGYHDRRFPCPALRPLATIVTVNVAEYRNSVTESLTDRRIQLLPDCGCPWRDYSTDKDDPVTPQIGQPARCWGQHN